MNWRAGHLYNRYNPSNCKETFEIDLVLLWVTRGVTCILIADDATQKHFQGRMTYSLHKYDIQSCRDT